MVPKFAFVLITLAMFSCVKTEEYRSLQDEYNELETYLKDNSITTEPSWTGLYLIESAVGEGLSANLYDTVTIQYSFKTLDGTLLNDKEMQDSTFVLVRPNVINGLAEAILNMKEGGEARAIIPSPLAYGRIRLDMLQEYSTVIYDIKLLKVVPGIETTPYYTDTIDEEKTASGLRYYKVHSNDSAIKAMPYAYLTVKYTGRFLNEQIFESSVKKGKTAVWMVGSVYNSLIPGLEEGLLFMKKGEKFRFYIPSDLAYGALGSFPVIPANTDLIFDIELLSVE